MGPSWREAFFDVHLLLHTSCYIYIICTVTYKFTIHSFCKHVWNMYIGIVTLCQSHTYLSSLIWSSLKRTYEYVWIFEAEAKPRTSSTRWLLTPMGRRKWLEGKIWAKVQHTLQSFAVQCSQCGLSHWNWNDRACFNAKFFSEESCTYTYRVQWIWRNYHELVCSCSVKLVLSHSVSAFLKYTCAQHQSIHKASHTIQNYHEPP